MYQALRKEAEKVSNEVIHFTQDLVRTPSPCLHEDEVASKVESMMRDLDYDLVFSDEVGNVIGVIIGGDPEFTVVMNSHMDTVCPDHVDAWSTPPFGGEIFDRRIHGLGASDCKSGLAAQIFAGHVLAQDQLALRGNIVMAATVAEENGCSVGVRYALQDTLLHIGMQPRFVVLGEPSSLNFGCGHDGWLTADIDVDSASHDTLRSATERVARCIAFHCDEQGFPERRAIMVSDSPTINETTATLHVKRRLFPGETPEDVIRWMETTAISEARLVGAASVRAHVHGEDQQLYTGHRRRVTCATLPWSTNLEHPLVNLALDALHSAGCPCQPQPWQLTRLGMGTAGSVITHELGLPVIGYGPGEETMAHATDESVEISSLLDAVYGSAVLMHCLSGAPVADWH